MNQMRETPLLGQSIRDGVLTLTLGAGKAHALSLEMLCSLNDALDAAEQDDGIKVIVVYGPGSIFCAGHDLKEISRHRQDPDQGRAYLTQLIDQCSVVMTRLTKGAKPTLAMVEGIATAAGLQIVAACDLAFVSTQARFCLPGVHNGGFCSTPAVAVGRVLSRKHALEMAMSGATYDADWALDAGLVNRVVAPEALQETVHDFARTLAQRHAPAVSLGKQTFYEQIEHPLETAYEIAGAAMLDHFLDPTRIEIERQSWAKG
ncbi:enoyl-CoA hydratase-related protein [Shimia thalassica]|uniref:enoyl-CoA hydratase-related protein n=1 Tax=Shimia thalassica TaxID=1715693 RepID=UPI0027361E10|nr:enoyl-CoA hydratase-related protein [Shimia thalassica]MDP2495351.1 enoyl-CoA hydratase-related protein [Shimia thalassica]